MKEVTARGPIAGFVILFTLLLPWFLYTISPDTTAYIQTARLYAQGHFGEAIREYWSPLFSWLIAVLLLFRIPDVPAAKLVCGLAGVAVVFGTHRLGTQLGLGGRALKWATWTAAIVSLPLSLTLCAPDLITAAFLLLYLSEVSAKDFRLDARRAILAGLWAAAAYLSKSYVMVFFGAHYLLAAFWRGFREGGWNRMARQLAAGYAVFALVAGVWIAAMSWKAGRLSLGSTSPFVFRWVGPASPGLPQHFALFRPAPGALSYWDEPTLEPLAPAWKPLSSEGVRHMARLLANNVRAFFYFLRGFHLGWAGILLAWVLWGLMFRPAEDWVAPLVAALLYPLGYLFLHIEARYVYLLQFLLILMAFRLLEEASQSLTAGRALAGCSLLALTFAGGAAFQLISQRGNGRELRDLALELRSTIPPGSAVAGCGRWNPGLLVSFYLGASYHGTAPVSAVDAQQSHPLGQSPGYVPPAPVQEDSDSLSRKLNAVRYFLVWPDCALPAGFDPGSNVTPKGLSGVQVYDRGALSRAGIAAN